MLYTSSYLGVESPRKTLNGTVDENKFQANALVAKAVSKQYIKANFYVKWNTGRKVFK